MSGTDVRPATSDDLDAIHRFGEGVVHDTYDTIVDVPYATALVDTWWSADALRADVDRGRILVATVQGRMVGLAQLGEWQDEAVM